MARNQKNYQNFLYVDDNATNWTKRGEDGGAGAAIDGHAAQDGSPMWVDGARYRARRVIAQDPTTFRTVAFVVYTPTAFSAISRGDTVAVQVAGLATTVNYTVIGKDPERQPKIATARQLIDA